MLALITSAYNIYHGIIIHTGTKGWFYNTRHSFCIKATPNSLKVYLYFQLTIPFLLMSSPRVYTVFGYFSVVTG